MAKFYVVDIRTQSNCVDISLLTECPWIGSPRCDIGCFDFNGSPTDEETKRCVYVDISIAYRPLGFSMEYINAREIIYRCRDYPEYKDYNAYYDETDDDTESPVYGGIINSAECTEENINDFISSMHNDEIPNLTKDTIDTTRFQFLLNATDIEKSAFNWFVNQLIAPQ